MSESQSFQKTKIHRQIHRGSEEARAMAYSMLTLCFRSRVSRVSQSSMLTLCLLYAYSMLPKHSKNANMDIAHINSSLAMLTSQPGLAEGDIEAFTYIHTCIHTHIRTYVHTCSKRRVMHTYIHAYLAARSGRGL
jgi:hypothetical protein